MRKMLTPLCRAITVLLVLCLAGMTAIMVSLVLTRYLFSFSPAWSEEATRYLMVWLVMLGGAVLVLFDDHITLHLFHDRIGPRLQRLQGIFVRCIILVVGAITAWTGYGFAFSMWDVVAPGSGIRMTVPIMAIPFSMTLITAFAMILILRDLAALMGRNASALPRQDEFMDGSFRPSEEE